MPCAWAAFMQLSSCTKILDCPITALDRAVDPRPHFQAQRAQQSRMRCSTTAYRDSSRTMPPLPTCPGCNSNCGLTSVTKGALGHEGQATPAWAEMNDKSPVDQVKHGRDRAPSPARPGAPPTKCPRPARAGDRSRARSRLPSSLFGIVAVVFFIPVQTAIAHPAVRATGWVSLSSWSCTSSSDKGRHSHRAAALGCHGAGVDALPPTTHIIAQARVQLAMPRPPTTWTAPCCNRQSCEPPVLCPIQAAQARHVRPSARRPLRASARRADVFAPRHRPAAYLDHGRDVIPVLGHLVPGRQRASSATPPQKRSGAAACWAWRHSRIPQKHICASRAIL